MPAPEPEDANLAGDRTADRSALEPVDAASKEPELTAEVSPEVAPVVGEFMEQAAQQNEAAADSVPEIQSQPARYISFEHVDKSFGDFVVLEDVSFFVNSGETLCILGRSGV